MNTEPGLCCQPSPGRTNTERRTLTLGTVTPSGGTHAGPFSDGVCFSLFLGGLVDRGKFCSRPNYCVPKPGSAVVFYARGSYASSLQGMDSGPGKLVGEDCRVRERERDVCDGMASDGNGSMEVDSVSVGGGATILEGQRSSGAGLDVAAADGTGRAGAEQNMATTGSTELQGLAALAASFSGDAAMPDIE